MSQVDLDTTDNSHHLCIDCSPTIMINHCAFGCSREDEHRRIVSSIAWRVKNSCTVYFLNNRLIVTFR